jgi:2-keto-4-pentenoate hydratase
MKTDEAATRQLRDYDAKDVGTIFDTTTFSVADAYEIQRKVCDLRELRGERIIGYKIGCVSIPLRESMGIYHPVYGRLFNTEQWVSGATLRSKDFSVPAIEGELAIRLSKDLNPDHLDDQSILNAIGSTFVVIEMHNKIFRRQPSAAELIANNALHAGVIYTDHPSSTIPSEPGPLIVRINDIKVAEVAGIDLKKTIITSLRWLSRELKDVKTSPLADQIILCGTITGMHLIKPKDSVFVSTENFGNVLMSLV